MAAKDSLGNQFVTLYRGLVGVTPEEVGQKNLGAHWSVDPNVAYRFATDEFFNVDDGTVIQAKVHKRHIVDPESEGWGGWGDGLDEFGNEQEHTVHPGAIVHVEQMRHVTDYGERLVTPKSRRGWRA